MTLESDISKAQTDAKAAAADVTSFISLVKAHVLPLGCAAAVIFVLGAIAGHLL